MPKYNHGQWILKITLFSEVKDHVVFKEFFWFFLDFLIEFFFTIILIPIFYPSFGRERNNFEYKCNVPISDDGLSLAFAERHHQNIYRMWKRRWKYKWQKKNEHQISNCNGMISIRYVLNDVGNKRERDWVLKMQSVPLMVIMNANKIMNLICRTVWLTKTIEFNMKNDYITMDGICLSDAFCGNCNCHAQQFFWWPLVPVFRFCHLTGSFLLGLSFFS